MEKTSKNLDVQDSAAGGLVITRHFDAPRALVYQAWTQPEHLREWSAPKGFVITHCDGDLRPGGLWRSCMRTPDGRDLWLGGTYSEVVDGQRLVMTHAWDGKDGKPGHETIVTVTFADAGSGTLLTFRQEGFKSAESRDGHRGGWEECFERLAAHLATTTTK